MSKLSITKKTLLRLWAATGLGAVLAMAVLQGFEALLKAKTGIGLTNLQTVDTGVQFRFLMDRWQAAPDAILAGFALGFDSVFIPLYAVALYCGCIIARDRFAPAPGRLRRILNALTLTAPIAALCDIAENTLELVQLTNGANDILAALAFDASAMKSAAILLGLAVNAAAIIGTLRPLKQA